MEKSNRKEVMAAFAGPLVASLVTLLIAPLSITLGFWLNDYWARPILSIEYVEIIPEWQRFPCPTAELGSLVQSTGFQMLRQSALPVAGSLQAYLYRDKGLTSDGVKSMKDGTNQFIKAVEDRGAQLVRFEGLLMGNPTEDVVRETALEYHGASGRYLRAEEDVSKQLTAILTKIRTEKKMGKESIALATALRDKLGESSARSIDRIMLQVSVLNKGNTDGLIRSIGEIQLFNENIELPIRMIPPPNKNGDTMGVLVRNVEPRPGPITGTSVGKIDKHSLTEFWYEIDGDESLPEGLSAFQRLIEGDNPYAFRIVLKNHLDDEISAEIDL